MTKNAPQRLTRRQELFCNYYARNIECFGNATEAYLRAYQLPEDKRGVAKSNGSRLLTNAYIQKRIDDLMDVFLEDKMADREMAYVLLQRNDLRAKVMAYREINKVLGRNAQRLEKGGEFTFGWEGGD